MKISRCLTVAMMLCVMATVAFGYDWVTQNPWPTSQTLEDVDFVSATTGWVVGAYGEILKTTDGGQTWNRQRLENAYWFIKVQFRDEMTGWAFGEGLTCPASGLIMKTTDGGETWQEYRPPCGMIRDAKFFSDSVGWLMDWEKILCTNDGGETWRSYFPGDGAFLYSASFVSADTGWVAHWSQDDNRTTMLQTVDGCENWTSQDMGAASWVNLKIHFLDSQHGWFGLMTVNGYRAYTDCYQTSDGGSSWTPILSHYANGVMDIQFTDSANGWLGMSGEVLHTVNGGLTWDHHVNTILNGDALDVLNENSVIVVGEKGKMLRTTNAGATWQDLTRGPRCIFRSAAFTSGNKGWVVSNDGPDLLYCTTDGGTNWTQRSPHLNRSCYTVAFADSNTGWITGYEGEIAHTSDGGNSWHDQNSGTTCNLSKIYPRNASDVWACGDHWDGDSAAYTSTVILHSTDGGQNWSESYRGRRNFLQSICFNTALGGWAVGGYGLILHTTDGGQSWNRVESGTELHHFGAVSFSDPNHGWILGSTTNANRDAMAMRTSNGGQTWEIAPLQNYDRLMHVSFSDSLHGWIHGSKSLGNVGNLALIHTTDGGDTWTQASTEAFEFLNDLCMLNDSLGWIVGQSGVIMRYGTPRSSAISQAPTAAAATLELGAYPNPFNAVTQIHYDLDRTGAVRLTIVNLLGQQVATLVDDRRDAGSYTASWNAADVPSGMYFAVLKAGPAQRIHKLVLLK
jgi:photosystem II stability/assembly factor-like uncharacterized protein